MGQGLSFIRSFLIAILGLNPILGFDQQVKNVPEANCSKQVFSTIKSLDKECEKEVMWLLAIAKKLYA